MSKYVINQDSNVQWSIDESNQSWMLGRNATISIIGEAAIDIALGNDDNLIRLKGDLDASGAGSEGVNIQGHNTLLKLTKTSLIEADDGIHNTSSTTLIRNAGEIDATENGILSDTVADIINRGTISGESGIRAFGGSAVVNEEGGLIRSELVAVRLAGSAGSSLTNHGTIRSDDVAVSIAGLGISEFTNTGKIVGDVIFGAGNDRINTLTGTIKGVVDGGAGNDIYRVGKHGGMLSEDVDSGWDQVFSTVGKTLGDNFEHLQLIGKKSINGTGNDGQNEVYGNAGNNTMHGKGGNDYVGGGRGEDALYGGGGADDFVFRKGDGHDTVHDFDVANDQLALLDFSSFESFEELATQFQQHGADVWINLGGGDRLVVKNIEVADIIEEHIITGYPMVM